MEQKMFFAGCTLAAIAQKHREKPNVVQLEPHRCPICYLILWPPCDLVVKIAPAQDLPLETS